MNKRLLFEEVQSFLSFVDRVYGLYLDATLGFEQLAILATQQQDEYINKAAEQQRSISPETLDQALWRYNIISEGSAKRIQHETTYRELKARNSINGPNARLFASLCIATIFHQWEDHFRSRIADALAVEKEAVKIPILGDLRLYRQAIVHHNGIATKEMKRCTEIAWFNEGEPIELYDYQVEQIVQKIGQGVNEFLDQQWRSA
jgi:hypothetical protein